MSEEQVRYYKELTDDFYPTGDDYQLPEGYRFIMEDLPSRMLSAVIYSTAVVFAWFYARFVLHLKIVGKEKIKKAGKSGYFLYGNHTQPVGDVFVPALYCFPRRIYTLAGKANYALPVIGKILPYLGALPVSDSIHEVRELNRAAEKRIEQGHPVVIYPEAHVWDYYTGIRPFPEASFKFPVKCSAPVFCFTVTYQKRRRGGKPKTTVYIDGPFETGDGSPKEKAKKLRDAVFDKMTEQSSHSDCEYIKYRKSE